MVTISDFPPAVNPRAGGPPHALAESLGPTRTYRGGRTLRFSPSADGESVGTVELSLYRTSGGQPSASAYLVTECRVSDDWNGRGFLFDRLDGSEVRAVFVSADGPDAHTCDCAGTSYGAAFLADHRHGDRVTDTPCKHIAAAVAMVRNGWADHPLARPEASEPEAANPGPACPCCGYLEPFECDDELVCPECLTTSPALAFA